MPDETLDDLRRINERLHAEENAGNQEFFERLLAPMFVLRRAKGEFQDRETFLARLTSGGERVCDPASIQIQPLGRTRALVTCVISIRAQSIDNARLFVRSTEGRWQMVAWVNEL